MRFLDRLIGKRINESAAPSIATGDDAAMAQARQAFDRKDYAAAWAIWRDLAERGVPRAQSNLAGLYSYGWGVPRDEAVAAAWFRRAGEAGDAIAQQNLALMYYEGRGTDGDLAEAARWYEKAAEGGLADAQNMLSWMYLEGVGASPRRSRAQRL